MTDIHSADGNDMAIALRRKVDFVGKTNKKSKVCVFWAFQSRRGSKFRHEVKITYSSLSGKRKVWFNGKMVHDSRQFAQKSHVPHRFRFEGGGYQLEILSLKHKENYKINLIVDDIPFIKLPRRTSTIAIKDVFKPRRMCRADGTWGESTAVTLGCTSEHLGKRLSGSKRKITYFFVLISNPERQHTVEVMYSILSGKRQIKVDGELLHKSQKLQMTLSFRHAFDALGGHSFEMIVQEKTDMIMTRLCIDGMDFRRLPLLQREQYRLAIRELDECRHKVAEEDEVEEVEEEEEEEEEVGVPSDDEKEDDKVSNDLLADLFGPDDSSQGGNSTPTSDTATFDPFAASASSSSNVVDRLGDLFISADVANADRRTSVNFVDSPKSSTLSSVMDPFAQLAARARAGAGTTTTRAPPPAAPSSRSATAVEEDAFDPFGEHAPRRAPPSKTVDPFAGF